MSQAQQLNPVRLTYQQLHTNEERCLAKAIYFETFQGDAKSRRAVGWAVYNRKFSPIFPYTICENINKVGEFPWRHIQSTKDKKYYQLSLQAAKDILSFADMDDPTNGSIFFASKLDGWFKTMINKGLLIQTHEEGGHRFYRLKE